ncbi:Hypothetical protein A7982_00535 [Minicystis rosea]|nr:Hypothetical protein A7982_00535 [Minicystis rosea]
MIRAAAVAFALIVCGCTRASSNESAPDGGASAASASASPPASASASAPSTALVDPPTGLTPLDEPGVHAAPSSSAQVLGAPLAPAEARRLTLARLADDRSLAQHEGVIREHFGGTVPAPLEVQITPLGGDRRAVLLYGPPRQRSPLLLVLDARGALLWTKEKPLAGTRQVVTEMAVTPGPKGEVALLWCDIPTQLVALRKWAWDGTVLADFEVAEVEVCEALSAIYWETRGWIAVASQHGAAKVQLLDERGKRAFGPRGIELPWSARPSAPAAIAVDSDTSAMIFQVGDFVREGGAATPDRVLAMRYDTLGAALWERAIDLGAAPAGVAGERIQTVRRAPGEVRVSMGKKLAVNITSAGSIPAR